MSSATVEAPNVANWLQTIVEAHRRFTTGPAAPNVLNPPMLEAFLLEHGQPYGPRIELPAGVEYGRAKDCYRNAFGQAFLPDSPYTYVEGYALTPGLIPVPHAWIVNERGEVIDPTWRDGGRECGFCDNGVETVEVTCEGCDADCDNGCTEEVTCFWCHGEGEQDHDHPSREGCEYFGIAVPRDVLTTTVLRKQTYGVLDDHEARKALTG